jgi:hypothetical protein
MKILSRQALTVVGMVAALQTSMGYRIASINDVHADLGYNPTSGTCITKDAT